MSEQTKRILLIIGFILGVLLMGALIFYFLILPMFITPTTPVTPINQIPQGGLPSIPPAINRPSLPEILNKITSLPPETPTIPTTPIIPGPTISTQAIGGLTTFSTLESDNTKNLTLANNGQDLLYYNTNTGSFYKINANGQKQLYSETTFKNVQNVTWSPNNETAVLEYPDGSNIIYDFNKKTSVTLPKQWEKFDFSTDGNQLVFEDMRLDPENRFLSVSDLNGTNYRQIQQLGTNADKVHVSWAPNNKYVALYAESIDSERAEVYPIGINQENYKKFRVEGRDLRFDWSPTGDKLLYSVFNANSNYNPSLWIVNSSPDLLSTGRRKLEIQTWADKCTFSGENTVYCGVPRTMETGTGFKPSMADNTPDDIYKIDLQTGSQELIAEPLYPTTVDKMYVSQDGKYLYWVEKNSGQIKKINL